MQIQMKEKRGYRSSFGRWPDVNIIFVIDAGCMHKPGHLALILVQFVVVIVHGGFGLFGYHVSIQVLPEPGHAFTTEDTENVSLLLCEFRWSFSAECGEVISQKVRDASQTQVCESWAIVNQWSNSLRLNQCETFARQADHLHACLS